MNKRKVRIYCFFSVKGGVGKSTLAVAAGSLISRDSSRKCVIVDLDLTGSSLADGLKLKAPRVEADKNGSLVLESAPTNGFFSIAETDALRNKRKANPKLEPPLPPPFLNDALAFIPQKDDKTECRLDAMMWRHDSNDRLMYLPSSSIPEDINLSVDWLYHKGWNWALRFSQLLHLMAEQIPGLSDIVLDLPPGLYGFSHFTLSLLADLGKDKKSFPAGYPPMQDIADWEINPFIVLTQDRGDLVIALEGYARLKTALPNLVPLINKKTESNEKMKDRVRKLFKRTGMEENLEFIDEYRHSLGKIFVEGNLNFEAEHEGFVEALMDVLRLGVRP